MTKYLIRLRQKHLRYWLTSIVILISIILCQPYILSVINVQPLRNYIYRNLSFSSTNPSIAKNSKLVLIRDREYWLGPLAHRVPTKRDYIASIVAALDNAEASVIALDFDFRTVQPSHPLQLGQYGLADPSNDYITENGVLFQTIGRVAQRRKIILAKTMRGPVDGPFYFGSDIYNAYGICTALTGDGVWLNPGTKEFPLTPAAQKNISCGYIALMSDRRVVPPPAEINQQKYKLDSFSAAIVRAKNSESLPRFGNGTLYASYISEENLSKPRNAISSQELLADPIRVRELFQGWPVIVGSGWNQKAFGEGGLVDRFETPVGNISGVLIHQNLVEAMLSGRIFRSLSEPSVIIIEIAFGILAALILASQNTWIQATIILILVTALSFFTQWMLLQISGAFIDLFLPVVGLGLHAVADRLLEADQFDNLKNQQILVARLRGDANELGKEIR